MTARFLRQEERAKAIERVQENLTGIKSYEWKWEQAKEAVLDPKLWFMFFFQIAQTIPNCVGTVSFTGLDNPLLLYVLMTDRKSTL